MASSPGEEKALSQEEIEALAVDSEQAAARKLTGWEAWLAAAICAGLSLYALYWTQFSINTSVYRATFLGLILAASFLIFPMWRNWRGTHVRIADWILIAIVIASVWYLASHLEETKTRATAPIAIEVWLGGALILLVLEATRRATGWALPIIAAATVRLEISESGSRVAAGWEFDRELVSPHGAFQAAGNPYEPRPVLKFHNPWTIRTAAGWSCLFIPPLNRPGSVVEVLAGVVDTDTYVAPVNLPFVALAGDGVHTLARGTPLAQVIPFERAGAAVDEVVRAESEAEEAERERIHRSTLAGAGWYARHARGARHAAQ